MKKQFVLIVFMILLSTIIYAQSCTNEAIIEKGVECNLPKLIATNQFLLPCIDPFGLSSLPIGTKINLDYKASACFTTCQQGLEVEILCVSFLSAVNEVSSNTELIIFPNPANNVINFKNDGITKCTILNYLGTQLFTKAQMNLNEVDISELKPGLYFFIADFGLVNKTSMFIKL